MAVDCQLEILHAHYMCCLGSYQKNDKHKILQLNDSFNDCLKIGVDAIELTLARHTW